MKIQDNRNQNTICFKDIAVGDVFECRDIFYLKIIDIKLDELTNINAIELEQGKIACFSETEQVKRINAELVVRSV